MRGLSEPRLVRLGGAVPFLTTPESKEQRVVQEFGVGDRMSYFSIRIF